MTSFLADSRNGAENVAQSLINLKLQFSMPRKPLTSCADVSVCAFASAEIRFGPGAVPFSEKIWPVKSRDHSRK